MQSNFSHPDSLFSSKMNALMAISCVGNGVATGVLEITDASFIANVISEISIT